MVLWMEQHSSHNLVNFNTRFQGLDLFMFSFHVFSPRALGANVITFPMMFLSGTFFPLSSMPLFLQAIAHVLPLTYVSDGLRASMIFGQSQTAILNTAIITMLGIACILIGSWITKWEEG